MSEDKRKELDEQNAAQAENSAAPTSPKEAPEERHIDLGANLRKEVKRRKSMSSKQKLLIGLVVVVVLALLITGLVVFFELTNKEQEPADTSTQIALIEGGYESIETIELQHEEHIVARNEGEDVFSLDGMDETILNEEIVSALFTAIGGLNADDLVTENPEDISVYGLDKPRSTMKVTFTDGTVQTFLLGNAVPTSAQSYVMEEGKSQVYLLSSYLTGKMLSTMAEFHDFSLPTVDPDNGQSLNIKLRGQEEWKMSARFDSAINISYWKMTEPLDMDTDTTTVTEIITSLSDLTLRSYVTQVENEAALAQYGLDDPIASLTYVDQNGESRTLIVGDKDENNNYYVQIDDSLDVYSALYSQVSFVENISLINTLDRFVNLITIFDVDQILVEKDGKTYDMTIERKEVTNEEGEADTEETFKLDGEVVEDGVFREAYQKIIGVMHSGLIDESKVGEDVVLSVRYVFNNGSEDLLVEYLSYDVNNYAVRRNGVTSVYCRKDEVDVIWPVMEQFAAGTLVDE